MKGYPHGFLPTVWTVCLAVLATGLLLIPTTLEMRLGWSPPWRLGGSARVGVAALHAAVSFALLLVAGALWSIHMRAGWRRRRQRKSGALLVLGVLGLALSAVGVYYLGDSELANGVALFHVALGLCIALPFGLHAMAGRQLRHAGTVASRHVRDRQQGTMAGASRALHD